MKDKIRDISTSDLKLTQHQQLLAEIEARDDMYERVLQLGQELLLEQKMPTKDVRRHNVDSSSIHIAHQCFWKLPSYPVIPFVYVLQLNHQ